MSNVCVVTGANAGIGRQAALGLAQRGQHVVLVCRDEARGRQAQKELIATSNNRSIDLVVADLADQASVRRAADELVVRYPNIHVLINNAALFDAKIKHPDITIDGIERIFATNYLGPFLLTTLLVERLKASAPARIINISSKGLLGLPKLTVDFEDFNQLDRKTFSATRAYYQSKLALLTWSQALSQSLKQNNVTVNSIQVSTVKLDDSRLHELGWFKRRIQRLKTRSALEPQTVAAAYVALALAETFKTVSGVYLDENLEPVKVPRFARNKRAQSQLLALSHELTSLQALAVNID